MKNITIAASAISLSIGLSSAAMAAGGCNPNGGFIDGLIRGLEGLMMAQSNGGATVQGLVVNRLSNNGEGAGEYVFITIGQNGVIGGGCTNAPTESDDLDPRRPK